MKGTWRSYAGASAGQSPLIHTLDVALSIHHKPMKASSTLPATEMSEKSKGLNPMLEMRSYLPTRIQAFLRHLDSAPSIRTYIEQLDSNNACVDEFNRCLKGMEAFRTAHIKMTSVYIILQQKKENDGRQDVISGVMPSAVGTGGTELIPFLKQIRQETVDALVTKST